MHAHDKRALEMAVDAVETWQLMTWNSQFAPANDERYF
jgi:hypothetical protein